MSVNQATFFSAARISLPSRWHRRRLWGLTGHRAPILNIISGCVYKRVSRWDEHSISGLSETDCPPHGGGCLPIHPGRTWVEQKVEEGGKNVFFYFPASLLSSNFSFHLLWPGFPGSQAVTLRLNHITGFPGLQLADSRSGGPPASMITWANSSW